MMPDYVCVSNFGVGGGFGFNRVDRFVNFIWVSCFFFFFGLILIGISSTSSYGLFGWRGEGGGGEGSRVVLAKNKLILC